MKNVKRVVYEIDPHNRLIAGVSLRRSGLPKFRHVIDGVFKIGMGNELVYHVKSPSQGVLKELDLPYQLKLGGTWSLTKNYDLKFTFDKCQLKGFRDEVVLNGEVLNADAGSLEFGITQKTADNAASTYVFKLEGVWRADKHNRLTFKAKKEKGGYDTLTFEGKWEIDKNHKIVYKYSKGPKKSEKSILFDGFWNIAAKNAVTYHLDFMNRSFFNFRVGAASVSRDSIRYEIGIGAEKKRRPAAEYLVLYGKWNIRERVGLIFEIDYGGGQIGGITFGAEARLAQGSKIEFDLKTEAGKPLGISLSLSKSVLNKAGELYSKTLFSEKEKAVYIGGGFKW